MLSVPLSTFAPEITADGIVVKQFTDILATLRQQYQGIYGSDTYLEPDSQDGQWLAVQAQAFFDLGQAIAQCYFAYSPTFAQGVGLSSLVKLNGMTRLEPTHSTAELLLVGQAQIEITNGAARDTFNNIWDLPATVTIPNAGQILALGTARALGRILADPNTITQFQSGTPGWQTVTNPSSAQPGNPLESDARLRRRQWRSTALPSITPIGGIYGTLANVTGVGRVEVYENDKDYMDDNGIPGHSIAPVVEGGDANDIAWAIALKKSPGCGTYGTTAVDVLDGAAQPNTIHFFYVDEVQVYVQIVLRPRQGYVASTAALIRQAVAYFINETRIGWPVYRAWLAAPAELKGDAATEATGLLQAELTRISETYVITDITIGRAPHHLGVADIVTRFFQSAATVEADIVVLTTQ